MSERREETDGRGHRTPHGDGLIQPEVNSTLDGYIPGTVSRLVARIDVLLLCEDGHSDNLLNSKTHV